MLHKKGKEKGKKNAIAYMHVCMCLHPHSSGCSGDDMRKREKREKNSR
jgi:hypothetical protein